LESHCPCRTPIGQETITLGSLPYPLLFSLPTLSLFLFPHNIYFSGPVASSGGQVAPRRPVRLELGRRREHGRRGHVPLRQLGRAPDEVGRNDFQTVEALRTCVLQESDHTLVRP